MTDPLQIKAQVVSLVALLETEHQIDALLGDVIYELTQHHPKTFQEFIQEVHKDLGAWLVAELKNMDEKVLSSHSRAMEKRIKEMERLLHVLTLARPKFSVPLKEISEMSEYKTWCADMVKKAKDTYGTYSTRYFLSFYVHPLLMTDKAICDAMTENK
jgi:hypothetical protein